MSNISIFAKHATLAKSDKHLLRGSSVIRGEQIAPVIGAKLNPDSGYENDICIYVKPNTQCLYAGHIKLAKNSFIDVVDSDPEVLYARKHPKVGIIACSELDYIRLKKLRNKVVLIPQHHCNFERIRRDRNGITTIGLIGAPGLFAKLPFGLKDRLYELGLELLIYSAFRSRQDVVNFYKKIDLQLVWRPGGRKLSNPLKIVNASSFGIPTIAYEEPAFSEVAGCYVPVKTVDELVEQISIFKNSPDLYAKYRDKCLEKSEEYHIDKIAKMYQQLENS